MPANPNRPQLCVPQATAIENPRPQLCVPQATAIENPSNPTAVVAVASTPNPVASGRPSLVELEAPMATPAAHYCYYTESDMCLGRGTGRRNGAGGAAASCSRASCSRRTAVLLGLVGLVVTIAGLVLLRSSDQRRTGGRSGGQGSGGGLRNRAPGEEGEGAGTAALTAMHGSYGGSSSGSFGGSNGGSATPTPPPLSPEPEDSSHLRTTTAPTPAPTAPPTPRFVLQTSGVCARPIASAAACAAAAKELGLRDQTVSDDRHTTGVDVDPKGCYYEGGSLKYNALQKNTGRCTQLDRCLCSRPAPTPAPTSAPTPSPPSSTKHGSSAV